MSNILKFTLYTNVNLKSFHFLLTLYLNSPSLLFSISPKPISPPIQMGPFGTNGFDAKFDTLNEKGEER